MGSLTARGRAAVVVAFLLSAGLATTAAVALVKVSGEDRTSGRTLPRVNPTLVPPSEEPSPTPSAVATASPTASPATSVTPSPAASATPAPRASSSPRQRAAQGPTYLSAKADLVPVNATTFRLVVRASDGDDRVVLSSVRWGDGDSASSEGGTRCSAAAGADCRVFTLQHVYAQDEVESTYTITVLVSAGKEKVLLTLHASVPALAASPSPSATPSPTPSA